MESQMRKQQREAVYAAQEQRERIINIVVGTVLTFAVLGFMYVIVYYIGVNQGRW
jgi:hypothetical protein